MARPAGAYCHVVSIVRKVVSQAARTGASQETIQVVSENQFARVMPITASEQLKATGQVTVGQYRVQMPFRNDVTAKHLIRWEDMGILLSVTGVMPNPTENEIEYLCTVIQ